MNFKPMLVGVAAVAALTAPALVTAPAQAANIASGSVLNLNSTGLTGGGVRRVGNTLDFFSATLPAIPPFFAGGSVGQGTAIAASTGTFANSNFISLPEIKDLALAPSGGTFNSGFVSNFLTGINFLTGGSASFDLTNFVYNAASGGADITGIFKSGSDSFFGSGTFTSQLGSLTVGNGPSSYSLSLTANPTPIPTPALLPGLIGLGVAALRKRKAEAVES